MSQNAKLSQRIQPHEATQWVIEAIRAVETSLELSRGEVHRLTRELAEAQARALPDGWVAVPVEPTGDLLREIAQAIQYPAVYAERSHPAALETAKRAYRAMLSARPGLPKQEPSNVE